MKKLFLTLIGVAALALAAVQTAEAQQSYAAPAVFTSTVFLASPTNLATPIGFFVGDRQHVGIQMTTTAASPGTTNIYTWLLSDDGSSFDTNAVDFITTTNIVIGLGPVTKVQDVNVQGHGYMELFSATIGNLTCTNTIKRSVKIQAP